jgi:hypothetical protein
MVALTLNIQEWVIINGLWGGMAMPAVGMVGKNGKQMAKIFLRMIGGKANCYHITEKQPMGPDVNILVAADSLPMLKNIASRLGKDDYMVVNADDKAIFPLISHCEATLITYGFNAKACITASSVAEDGIQVCVQRAFTGINGTTCFPQEFFAKADGNCEDVLAAAAALVVCGMYV